MSRNPASIARRQRERARQRKRREKQAAKAERRELKKTEDAPEEINPVDDPTIDWGEAVQEVSLDEAAGTDEEDDDVD